MYLQECHLRVRMMFRSLKKIEREFLCGGRECTGEWAGPSV